MVPSPNQLPAHPPVNVQGMPERNSPAERADEDATRVASRLMPTTVDSALTRREVAPVVEHEQGARISGVVAPRQPGCPSRDLLRCGHQMFLMAVAHGNR